jgi:hypothetical protein
MSPTKVIARPSGLIDNSVDAWQQTGGLAHVAMFQWDIDLLEWVKSTAGAGGGGGLTDAQLRATPVPVSASSWPLPTDASTEVTLASILAKLIAAPATEATLASIKAKTDNLDVALSTRAITGLTDAQLRASPVAVSVSTIDQTASAPANSSVGVASASAIAANGARTGLILINTSTAGQRISLGLDGAAAVLDNGITLEVGDSWLMEEYDFTTGAVAGIASAASARLSVQEFA